METSHNSGDVVVRPGLGRVLLTPYGTMLRAREFFEASEFLRLKSTRFSPVSGFLACRAVELSLKAYLGARGVSPSKIRLYKHDLTRLFIDCQARGLDNYVTFEPTHVTVVTRAGKDYSDHRWAYFDLWWVVGGGFEPDPAILSEVAKRLVDSIETVTHDVAMGDGSPLAPAAARR